MNPTDVADTRRKNLDDLIGNPGIRGRIANFCRSHDLDPTYIGMLLNRHRNIGERTARKLENKIGIPPYSLDVPNRFSTQLSEESGEYKISLNDRLEAIIATMSDEERERAIRLLEVAFSKEEENQKQQ